MAKPATLGLRALVALVDPPKVAPEDAQALGTIHLSTEEDRDWGSEEVKKRLRGLRFRTVDDTWVEAARLVVGAAKGVEKDEVLRYDLAPPERRLHPSYWEDGETGEARMALFILARERRQADSQDLAVWVSAATTLEAKHAALVYLSDGDLGQTVADLVKAKGWLPQALHDPALKVLLNPLQVARLQARLASATQLQQVWQTSSGPVVAPPSLDLGTALSRLAAWWSKNGVQEAKRYRQELYPAGELCPATGSGNGGLRPFVLADPARPRRLPGHGPHPRGPAPQVSSSIASAWAGGRLSRGLDPKQHPASWMNVIEEYAEAQGQDESNGPSGSPSSPSSIASRRWMDEYVELFLSIDRLHDAFPAR